MQSLNFNNLFEFFDQLSDAIIVENGGVTVFKNDASKRLFPGTDLLLDILPAVALETDTSSVKTCIEQSGKTYFINMFRIDECRVYTVAEEKNEEKLEFDFLSTVNEAMRSPLATLSSAANMMMPVIENSGNDVLSKNLAAIYKNYFKLLRLSNNISGFAEMRTHRTKLRLDCVDLLSLCGNLVDTVSLLTKERGIKIWYKTSLTRAKVMADFDKIEYVLLNLLSNSLNHTKIGDDITVNISRANDYFVVTVTDTGTGVSSNVIPSLFEPRLTRKTLNDPEQGLGMGLAYSRHLISAHGGSMVMGSREEQGTTVKFTLPVYKSGDTLADAPIRYGENGLTPVLTELSDILSLDCFDAKYLD